uniref:Uncharacterized protein n=1 Tax=Vespula pensylvanica TaxID=30213 RepID=A0A834P5F8_VESPE|nr:hypothetical protein H0235_005737 [Vespula pensylvanica]
MSVRDEDGRRAERRLKASRLSGGITTVSDRLLPSGINKKKNDEKVSLALKFDKSTSAFFEIVNGYISGALSSRS